MKDSINLNSSAQGTPSYLNLISMLMIVVILFQPFYYIILESIDSKQEISMMDKDLNDMEGDDNQEEETEENEEKFFDLNLIINPNVAISEHNQAVISPTPEQWSEFTLGIITPPPELT